MNPSRKTKTLLFDFGGTLDSDGVNWKDRFHPIYRAAGVDWDEKKFTRAYYDADDYLTAKTLGKVSYFPMLRMQVGLVLKKGGRPDARLAERISRYFGEESLRILERNRPTLLALKKRYRLGIVSNFYGNLPYAGKGIGLDRIFDVIVDSGRVGCIKPDPRIFLAALDPLKSRPREACFIGDSQKRDMLGAKALGMRHIWLLPPEGGKTCCPGDTVIRSLPELQRIFL